MHSTRERNQVFYNHIIVFFSLGWNRRHSLLFKDRKKQQQKKHQQSDFKCKLYQYGKSMAPVLPQRKNTCCEWSGWSIIAAAFYVEFLTPHITSTCGTEDVDYSIFVFFSDVQHVRKGNAPVCQTQEAGQLNASVLADVHIVEELSLQLSDLLFGVRASSFPLGTLLPCSGGGKWQRHDSKWSLMTQTDSPCPNNAIIAAVSICRSFHPAMVQF